MYVLIVICIDRQGKAKVVFCHTQNALNWPRISMHISSQCLYILFKQMSSLDCPSFHNTTLSEEFVIFPPEVASLSGDVDSQGPSLMVQQDGSVKLHLCFYDTNVANRMYGPI